MANQMKTKEAPVSKIFDDEYVHVENEYEQVQKFIGMYISYRGTKAAVHLMKEIFNNALDEAVNEHSPCDKIDVFYDEESGIITVSDNGRGIPHDILLMVCTKKHTTTKEGRKFNVESAGENGVGLKVTCALSDYCKVTSYRGDYAKSITVTDGRNIVDGDPVKLKKPKTGLTVEFAPSEKYLGKFNLTIDDICDWLRCISYICPKGIKMKFMATKKKSNAVITRVYEAQGLAADVRFMAPDIETVPVEVGFDQIKEDDPEREYKVDMAFSYDLTTEGEVIDSYCNYVHTIENGTHVAGCESAICAFFTKEGAKLDPNSKYPIVFEDCKKGLILAVNCRAARPNFSGQVKERVGNEHIQTDTRKQMIRALEAYFVHNPATLKKIIDYLRKMAKIRLTAHSMKGLDSKKTQTWADEREVRNFVPLSDRNSKGYKELFICEGLSAGRQVASVVDHRYQAVFWVRGVVPNTHDTPTDKTMKSDVFRDLIKILGCGIGKDFRIQNLRYDRIIILTDSDVDGANITSLLCAFFAVHLPDIILEERLYKSVPPLYLLENKGSKAKYYKGVQYLFSKREYNDLYNQAVAENVQLFMPTDNDVITYATLVPHENYVPLTKKQSLGFMEQNLRYLYHLNYLAKTAGAPVAIIEMVCWEWLRANGDVKRFKKLIEQDYPECTYDIKEQSLSGAVDKQFIALICDRLFFKSAQPFMNVMKENPVLIIGYRNKSTDVDPKFVTIGEFLTMAENGYSPDIKQRFKGLGEMPHELLFVSTLNPVVRRLYKITMHDVTRAMEQLDILHGKTRADDRKKMIDNDQFTVDDIDN